MIHLFAQFLSQHSQRHPDAVADCLLATPGAFCYLCLCPAIEKREPDNRGVFNGQRVDGVVYAFAHLIPARFIVCSVVPHRS